MKLYRIRRKSDGKYFKGLSYPWHYTGHERWNESGAFYKRIDTIVAYLKCLQNENWKKVYTERHRTALKMAKGLKLDAKKLQDYEIIINHVTVNREEVIQVEDLVERDYV